MAITSIPTQGEFNGPKTNAVAVTAPTKQIQAADFNAQVTRQIEAHTAIGLDDGTTVGSLRQLTPGWKLPARVAVQTNVTIASPGATLDGVTMAVGDRVLLIGQSTLSQNGWYDYNGAAVPMTRCPDADSSAKMKSNVRGGITDGTSAGLVYTHTSVDPITLGSTSLFFSAQLNTTRLISSGTVDGTAFNGGTTDIGGATGTVNGTAETFSVSYSGGTCALTLANTFWNVGSSRRISKVNTSTNPITLAPPSGGTINGGAVDAVMTLPGSGLVSSTARGNLFWIVTRTATNTWQVAGSAQMEGGGALIANRFAAQANGSASAPAVTIEPLGDSGDYWDATKGVVRSVNSVDRVMARVDGTTEIASGVGGTTPVFKISNTAGDQAWFIGSGTSPEGVVTANVGDWFIDNSTGDLWKKQVGSGNNAGWRRVTPSESGTYTPTATAVTNLDSVTPKLSYYIRVGDIIHFAVRCTVDPTASGTITFALSLPIASAFSAVLDCSGVAQGAATFIGVIEADPTNDRFNVICSNTNTASYDVTATGSYRVL